MIATDDEIVALRVELETARTAAAAAKSTVRKFQAAGMRTFKGDAWRTNAAQFQARFIDLEDDGSLGCGRRLFQKAGVSVTDESETP